MTAPTPSDAVGRQLALYVARLDDQKRMTEALVAVLRAVTEPLLRRNADAFVHIGGRTKSFSSFAEKVTRPGKSYVNAVEEMTDLTGVRVIVESRVEVEWVLDRIAELEARGQLAIDHANSGNKAEQGDAAVFGYASEHKIVSFPEGAATVKGIDIPDAIRARRDPADLAPGAHPAKFRAEIQVRTLLQHAWANQVHDRIYKAVNEQPRDVQRAAHRIAAQLEAIDGAFLELRGDLEFFASDQLSFRPKEEIESELRNARATLDRLAEFPDHAKPGDRRRVAIGIARLHAALGQWSEVEDVLAGHGGSEPDSTVAFLRGAACARIGRESDAIAILESAIAASCATDDIHCELAELSLDTTTGVAGALEHYEKALRIAPHSPRALRDRILLWLLQNQMALSSQLLLPAVRDARAVVQRLLDGGLYIPRAYFDLALYLLLDTGDESASATSPERDTAIGHALGLCALGIARCHFAEPIAEAHRSFQIFGDIASRQPNFGMRDTRTLAPLQITLLLALAIAARGDRGHLEVWIRRPVAGGKALHGAFLETRAEAARLYRGRNVVILAGSSLEGETPALASRFGASFATAFGDFAGTIVTPGTDQGCGALLKGVVSATATCVAYLPRSYRAKLIPGTVAFDVPNPRSSFEEVLLYWAHLLDAGVDPRAVRVVGVGGGPIAMFEYRFAAALGATVGLLEGSGRAAEELLADKDWTGDATVTRNLFPIPSDPETLRAFVQPPDAVSLRFPCPDPPAVIETLARHIHEAYRLGQFKSGKRVEASMKAWEHLRDDFRESNRDQARSYVQKLARIGLEIVPADQHDPSAESIVEANVPVLAPMEHGRWNVERLRAGWRRGPRNDAAKRHPDLTGWAALNPDVKPYDEDAIRTMLVNLKACGFGVRRMAG